MKHLSKIVFTFLSLTFFACSNEESSTEFNHSNEKIIAIEDHGKFHNESILNILDIYQSSMTFGEVFAKMRAEMTNLHPKSFEETNLDKLKDIFEFDQKISEFKYSSKFYEELKNKVGVEKIDTDMLLILDKAFYEGNISKKDFSALKASKKDNKKFQNQFDIFVSYYSASEELWKNKAPNKYKVKFSAAESKCDPTSQVIIADAVGGTLIGILTGGVGAPLGGGAVSLAVRTAQLEEYGGGCIR